MWYEQPKGIFHPNTANSKPLLNNCTEMIEHYTPSYWTTQHHTGPHSTTLDHTAPHWTTQHHTEPHSTTLDHTGPHSTTLDHTASHWTTQHHTGPHSITPDHTAPHWITQHHIKSHSVFQPRKLWIQRSSMTQFQRTKSIKNLVRACSSMLLQCKTHKYT